VRCCVCVQVKSLLRVKTKVSIHQRRNLLFWIPKDSEGSSYSLASSFIWISCSWNILRSVHLPHVRFLVFDDAGKSASNLRRP